MIAFTGRWLRLAAGLLLGGLTALAELVCVADGGVRRMRALATGRPPSVPASALRLAELERRRLAVFHAAELDPPGDGRAAFGYLAARWPLGLFGLLVLLTSLVALLYSSLLVWTWFVLDPLHPGTVTLTGLGGLFLLFLCAQGGRGLAQLDEQLARRHLGPSETELLLRRVGELAATRAGVVQAVHDERRRIERDLHDGVQQRLVALGLLLGRARRAADPAKADALLRQAHEESADALTELRETAWRIYPAALDEHGLAAALEGLAERSVLPVDVTYELDGNPPPVPVQTVAYFVAAEAVTNTLKHSGATRAEIRVTRHGDEMAVRIEDDGTGGAPHRPTAGGLLGLSRRVAALDGRLDIHSPSGGPTVITAELPCAS
ncbi:sensor histidine kinase [Streptomyces viridochromogenes]|uniref:sensor histidine kinase n=1 Tax=Streptomyces viridochromogenes TaxID=1938 RepID=UPI00069E0A78|nr:ATPase [Streptomyces viridochromogenes]KOG17181.1 ATPase [Streptomyces viridochromogenes]